MSVVSEMRLLLNVVLREFLFCFFGVVSMSEWLLFIFMLMFIVFVRGIILCRNNLRVGILIGFICR